MSSIYPNNGVTISAIGDHGTLFCYTSINPYKYPDNIRRQSYKFIFDPGASATILSKRIYDQLPEEAKPELQEIDCKVTSAQGASITLHGECVCNIELQGKEFKRRVLVCDVTEDGFIGNDMMWGHGMSAQIDVDPGRSDGKHDHWIINKRHKVYLHPYRPQENPVQLITVNRIVLQAGEGYMVPVETKYHMPPNDFIVKPLRTLSGSAELDDLQIANSIVDNDNGKCMIIVTNTSNKTKICEQGVPIAECCSIRDYKLSKPIEDPIDNNKTKSKLETDKQEKRNKRQNRRKVRNIRIRCLETNTDTHMDCLPTHLKDLYKRSSTNLNIHQKAKLSKILQDNANYFAKDDKDFGFTDLVTHDIDTGDHPPIRQKVRHQPLSLQEIEEQAINDMKDSNQIEPSNSPWASPVVLAKKKDGTWRFCIDYRKLNDITIKDAYPLPNISECMNTLNGAKWFCTMDLKSGYWHVGLTPRAKEKSAFICKQGLFQWRVMPFGLCNAPPTFERLMETVLRGMQWKTCLVYLDDVIVFGHSFEQCAGRLDSVIKALGEAGLKIKAKKCDFFKNSVKFLGHTISEKGIHTDPDKIKEIAEWPIPKEGRMLGKRRIPFITQIKSFLGVCSYYRKFISNFAKISEPLQKYTRDGVDLTWDEEAEQAFYKLKSALISAPVLAYPQLGKPFLVDTDACDYALGAVLSQCDDKGKEHPVAFMSKVFNKSEKNHCIWRKEFMAVYKAVKHFEPYIYGQKVTVRTDNSAVSYMMKMSELNHLTARMVTYLNSFDIKVEHRKGREHVVPDALSRKPEPFNINNHSCNQCKPKQAKDTKDCVTQTDQAQINCINTTQNPQQADKLEGWSLKEWNIDRLKEEQSKDPDLILIIGELNTSKDRPLWQQISSRSFAYKTLWAQWDTLKFHNGLLYREITETDKLQLILPRSMRRDAFDFIHGGIFGGHLGYRKTLGKLRSRFYWPRISTDTKIWVMQCDHCHGSKPLLRKTHSRLVVYTVGAPMERSAMDITGPLPKTKRGNRYVLVIGDYFTRWVEAIPLSNYRAETIARAIIEHYVSKFGVPLSIHSDQGRSFESNLMAEFTSILGMHKTRTMPYRPQSDGFIERFNRTLGHMLRACISEEDKAWDDIVPLLAMSYRSSINETTGFTPNMLMLGREVMLPIDLVMPKRDDKPQKTATYVENLRNNMEKIYEEVRRNTSWQVSRQKKRYDATSRPKGLQIGDLVWLNLPSLDSYKSSRKLRKRRTGPHIIVGKQGDVKFLVKKTAQHKPVPYHEEHLLKYNGTKKPRWIKMELDKLESQNDENSSQNSSSTSQAKQ